MDNNLILLLLVLMAFSGCHIVKLELRLKGTNLKGDSSFELSYKVYRILQQLVV